MSRLPSKPWQFGDLITDEGSDSYRQRWLPGAFDEHADISDVVRFRVHEDEWNQAKDGTWERTILRAEVIEGRA